MRIRPLLAGAAALALTLSLSACGDDGDEATSDTTEADASDDTETSGTETESATEPETESESESETETESESESETTETETEDTGSGGAPGDLTGLLLTPEDVGPGFAEQPYEEDDEPTPCGAEIDQQNPYDAIVGTVLAEEERQLYLQHELRTYADEEAAAATFAAAQEGFGCGAETTQPGVSLGEVTDVSAEVGAEAFVVEVNAEGEAVEGGLVVAQVGPVLSVYQFQGPTDIEDGPDSQAIVAANIEVLQTELG